MGGNKSDAMIKQNTQQINQQGGQLSQEALQQQQWDQDRANEQYAHSNAAYDNIENGGAGYTPEQQAQLMGTDRLNGLRLTDADKQDAYLSSGEQKAISGNPYGAYDPSSLAMSDSYGNGMNGAINQANQNVRGAIDPSRLSQSQDFVNSYRMSPDQVQQFTTSAARSSDNVARAEMDRNSQLALASGADPMGMASYLSRANQGSRIAAANAAAGARVQADQIRAGREKDIEDSRLSANQQYAGLKSQSELALENNAMSGMQNVENTRLGANRDIATRGTAAEQTVSDRAAALAGNRQTTAIRNQDTGEARNQYIDSQTTGRAAAIADAGRADLAEARQYHTNQGNTFLNASHQALGTGVNVYGAQTGANNTNTANQVEADKRPKPWEQILSAGASVAGSATGAGLMKKVTG